MINENRFKVSVDTIFFFDMDGTLVHSDFANYQAYKKAIYTVLGDDICITYSSKKRFDRNQLRKLKPNLSYEEFETITRIKEEYFFNYLHEIKPNDQIINILNHYSKRHITVLVSNSKENRAISILNHIGLMDNFTYIFCKKTEDNDKKVNKFQNAITTLNISPKQVIAFENEECEIDNALKSGISIINPI